MAVSKGNCFICGKTAGKVAIKNHILKEHDKGSEDCLLMKAEGAYNKDYWLYFSIPLSASLSALDIFLRGIWCECCDHLSAFQINRNELCETTRLSDFYIDDVIFYDYDFGSTTKIQLTVVDVISRKKKEEIVQLLARNVPVVYGCDECNEPAIYIDIYNSASYCEKCAESLEDGDMLMRITNSPRCGVCGYGGELDIWTFDPEKPFPQPQKDGINQKRKLCEGDIYG